MVGYEFDRVVNCSSTVGAPAEMLHQLTDQLANARDPAPAARSALLELQRRLPPAPRL